MFVSAATILLHCHIINWVRDATASTPRTTSTNLLTAVSRESQVPQVSPHTQETSYYFSLRGTHSTITYLHSLQLSTEFPSAFTQSLTSRQTARYVLTFPTILLVSWLSLVLALSHLFLSVLSLLDSEFSNKQHSHKVPPRHWKWGRVTFDSQFQPCDL